MIWTRGPGLEPDWLLPTDYSLLALEVDQVLEDLVRGGDHARVRLEAALRDDHVRELGRQVHVRHLQEAGLDRADAECAITGGSSYGSARVPACLEEIVA